MKTATDNHSEEKNGVMTVEAFRQKGFKVEITHFRKTKGKKPRLAQKHEVEDKNMINPRGGATFAKIQTPDGVEAVGQVNVFYTDNYCKKTGISYALAAALADLKDK